MLEPGRPAAVTCRLHICRFPSKARIKSFAFHSTLGLYSGPKGPFLMQENANIRRWEEKNRHKVFVQPPRYAMCK